MQLYLPSREGMEVMTLAWPGMCGSNDPFAVMLLKGVNKGYYHPQTKWRA